MSLLDKKIEDCVDNKEENSELIFEYDDIFEYDYPYEDFVPEDYYYSQLIDVRQYTDRYKNTYVTVYYKIFQTIMCDRWNGGYISEIPYYYICQKYEKNDISYNKFCASMHKATGLQKFSSKSLKGKTEIIHLTYAKDGCIGAITERKPVEIDSSWFED